MIPMSFRMSGNVLVSLSRQVLHWPLPASPASILGMLWPFGTIFVPRRWQISRTHTFTPMASFTLKRRGGSPFFPRPPPSRSSPDVNLSEKLPQHPRLCLQLNWSKWILSLSISLCISLSREWIPQEQKETEPSVSLVSSRVAGPEQTPPQISTKEIPSGFW